MARLRQVSNSSASPAPKRQRSVGWNGNGTSQTMRNHELLAEPVFGRDYCQRTLSRKTQHVSFPSVLEQGPTTSKFENRAASPSRSAIRDLASVQLLKEEAASHKQLSRGSSPQSHQPSPYHDDGNADGFNDDEVRDVEVTGKQGSDDDDDDDDTNCSCDECKDAESKGGMKFLGRALVVDEMKGASDKQKDDTIVGELEHLHSSILELASMLTPDEARELNRKSVLQGLVHFNEETVRYIGNLATGGQGGDQGWADLLEDKSCRRALMCGIISQALRESIFGHLWFGGSEQEISALREHERKSVHFEGFQRTADRSAYCRSYQETSRYKQAAGHRDSDLIKAQWKVVRQISQLLAPLYYIDSSSKSTTLPLHWENLLSATVDSATSVSRMMRLQEDTVYHWPPTFKDEEFDPERMECGNLTDMIRDSPYEKTTLKHGRGGASLVAGSEDRKEAIVRVVMFSGVVAYRKGGGELAAKILEEERKRACQAPPDVQARERRDAVEGEKGYRARVLCKGVVHLQWGRQRLLTKEAGTSAHLDAKREHREDKYIEDYQGFRELHDIWREQVSMAREGNDRRSPTQQQK